MAKRERPQILRAVTASCALFLAGCAAAPKPEDEKRYMTIAADPNRATDKAIKHHEKAIKIIEHAMGSGLYQCSCIGKVLCNVHKAEQHLHDALVADVRYGPAHNTLGLLYYHQRRFYMAAWEFEYAADLMPSMGEPLNNLGMVYEEVGELTRAVQYYSVAAEMQPGNPVFLGNLARTHLRLGDDVEAVRPLLKQLLLHDTRPEWLSWAEDLLGKNPISLSAEPITAALSDSSAAEEVTAPPPIESGDTLRLPEPLADPW